jgi:Flp pilus assembly protein TadG
MNIRFSPVSRAACGRSPSRRARRNRRGTAVVEFAVVAPLFILLVFGMIEFGRMIMVQQIMTNASREGTRRAIIEGSTQTEVENLVTNYLDNASVPGATVTVTPSDLSNVGFGDPVSVSVSIPFNTVSWIPSPMYLEDATLQASTVMQAERFQ